MAGAYVAKPDVPVVPEVPDDWNPDWPFPGAAPPGYDYEYSLQISGVSGISPSGNVVPTATIFDHTTYRTIPIAETVKQTWSGSIGGVAVGVKLQGDDDYSESVESSYSQFDSLFWGAQPELQFDLSGAEAGDTLTVRVQSLVGGGIVSATQELPIAITATFSATGSFTAGTDGEPVVATCWIAAGKSGPFWPVFGDPTASITFYMSNDVFSDVIVFCEIPDGDFSHSTTEREAILSIDSFDSDVIYDVYLKVQLSGSESVPFPTGSWTVTLTVAGESHELVIPLSVDDIVEKNPWARINGSTGEVTIF
jgi:hypothetical protein